MKEIKEEIKYTETKYSYQAIDGEIFSSKEECEKYEKTAECILRTRYNCLVLKSSNEYALFGFGNEDSNVDVVKLRDSDDVTLIMQLYLYINSWIAKDLENSSNKNRIKKCTDLCERALKDNDLLFVYRGYDNDVFSIEGTRNQHIEVLQNLCKDEA